MIDVILDTLLDSVKILPFLFVTYLIMEYLESRTEDNVQKIVRKAGWLGPFWGGILGIVPQCGFSAAAANLYAGRAISLGTLLAVFLSTSDEMVPIMISETVPAKTMLHLLFTKAVIAVIAGFVIDAVCHILASKKTGQAEDDGGLMIERLCEKEHCHCEEGSILKSALRHTINILVFVFVITLVLNMAFHFAGEDRLIALAGKSPAAGLLAACIIGLIPNCGASVLLTQMYLRGIMTASQLIAGLLVGAGVGLLVLFRVNPDQKENLLITAILFAAGILGGILVGAMEISF
ncbi:MAG: arsenic efflux protein [Blautia sp.]|nr:arsenic efflux protein [Blautia sp.]